MVKHYHCNDQHPISTSSREETSTGTVCTFPGKMIFKNNFILNWNLCHLETTAVTLPVNVHHEEDTNFHVSTTGTQDLLFLSLLWLIHSLQGGCLLAGITNHMQDKINLTVSMSKNSRYIYYLFKLL